MRPHHSALLLTAIVLAACTKPRGTPDNEPTLKAMGRIPAAMQEEKRWNSTAEQAIHAYRQFLQTAPAAPQRAEALRRIADLEMTRADLRSEAADATSGPDYTTAMAGYREFLASFPQDPRTDRVLYQLARAQEQSGQLGDALKTLDELVQRFAATPYLEEAQFRRGELLFTARDYQQAQKAYSTVLKTDGTSRYHDRALYMQGWAQFKQGSLGGALESFLAVLDIKLAGGNAPGSPDAWNALSRADRELTEDTFRVISLGLAGLDGAESIPPLIDSATRQSYEFRIYEQLGGLYLKQERIKDAADTFALFARNRPLDPQAPLLQARVIDIYAEHGFSTQALNAKKDYVERYGRNSALRQAKLTSWEQAQPLVKTHLASLANHYHASAQKSKIPEDVREAIAWYREYLAAFPTDSEAASNNFLLAELLYEDRQYAQALAEYERTAYRYPLHAKSADAGYAALLSYAAQVKTNGTTAAADLPILSTASIASALRFADTFSADSRAPLVLADTAEKLYALKDLDQASQIAQRLISMEPQAPLDQQRTAWTIMAHAKMEQGSFEASEQAYTRLLALTPEDAPQRKELIERLAASVYKQGEAAVAAGRLQEAVGQFQRVAIVAPQSAVRATATYDAATSLLALHQWTQAANELRDFRTRFPQNSFQSEIGGKLALAYFELAQWGAAAQELERVAASRRDPQSAREALWQAATLYEKAGNASSAKGAYERYLAQNVQLLEPSMEARFKLAQLAAQEGNTVRELALMKELVQQDRLAGAARSERTRFLGASGALALAEPLATAFRNVALTEPLQRQLKLKKVRMEEALKAYEVATGYGVAGVTTASTYRIASLYRDFARALMTSERPKKLNKLEREQYNVLLEEQAFPFEEKAAALHEVNTQRVAAGLYDTWIQRSFEALKELRPVRFGKAEKTDKVFYAIQ